MLCLNVLGCRFNIFGNNISKPMFSTSHYIISKSTESCCAVISDAECDSLVKVGIIVWLL